MIKPSDGHRRIGDSLTGTTRKHDVSEKDGSPGYTLIRSRRRKKTLSIQVKRDCSVLVQVPFHTGHAEIDRFFNEKKQWLQQKIHQQLQRNQEQRDRVFIPGERFPYLGESYPLKVTGPDESNNALIFTGREFILKQNALKGARILFCLWYQERAKRYLKDRVRHYSALTGLFPRDIAIGNARRRWGTCSADSRLTFAWRLIMAPVPVIDYVIVHELCHIRICNHSRDYWCLVEEILPGYRQYAAWLKDRGHLLTL